MSLSLMSGRHRGERERESKRDGGREAHSVFTAVTPPDGEGKHLTSQAGHATSSSVDTVFLPRAWEYGWASGVMRKRLL